MQVNQVNDHISHAVIGKNKARDFGISDSAEFFNILSNTLYSDKILAVVREVLCNAWDIHIQTGRTDVPVEVTLMDGKLTIRDHGTGISDEDIHPIYAVYGNSTKKLDGTQTGGFGLGSKAPFAYVDHFEVTSFYKGTKTIYAVSKSSAEVAGKPSIQDLVSVPCGTETGLMVSMNIHSDDRAKFDSVIQTIALFGEMNIKYTDYAGNSTTLKTIPFSQAKHGFLMTQSMFSASGSDSSRIFIRYGNVVYPVPVHDTFRQQYNNIVSMIDKIGGGARYHHMNTTKWHIIFQAKPNTISVTPSREALSMTDNTAAEILKLLEAFNTLTTSELEKTCLDIERETIEITWTKGRAVDLLDSNNKVPQLFDKEFGMHSAIVKEEKIISDIKQIGRAYMAKSYPNFPSFRKKDMDMRMEALEKSGLGGLKNRGKIQSFRKEYAERGNAYAFDWFQKTLVNPLIKRLDEVPELSGSKLLVYGDHMDRSEDRNGRRRSYHERRVFTQATKLSPRKLEDYQLFLRNMVVISFNRIDIEERLPKFPQMKELGRNEDFFIYIVSRADKKIDIVRKFFQDQGMTVVDLTQRGDWEPEHILEPIKKEKTVVKPRKKGLPKLSALISGGKLDYTNYQTEGLEHIERTENPEFIVQFNPRAQSADILPALYEDAKLAAVELYGDRGAVVVNDNQRIRFQETLKIPLFPEWLLAKLKEEVLNNPRLQFAFAANWEKLPDDMIKSTFCTYTERRVFFNLILNNPDLAIEFGVLNEMTKDDYKILKIIKGFNIPRQYHYRNDKTVLEINKHIENVQITPEIEKVAELVANSKLIGLLNNAGFSGVFSEEATDHQKKQRPDALDILQYVLI